MFSAGEQVSQRGRGLIRQRVGWGELMKSKVTGVNTKKIKHLRDNKLMLVVYSAQLRLWVGKQFLLLCKILNSEVTASCNRTWMIEVSGSEFLHSHLEKLPSIQSHFEPFCYVTDQTKSCRFRPGLVLTRTRMLQGCVRTGKHFLVKSEKGRK